MLSYFSLEQSGGWIERLAGHQTDRLTFPSLHTSCMARNALTHHLKYSAPAQTHLLNVYISTSKAQQRVHSLPHYSTFHITFITLHHVHSGPFAFSPFFPSFFLSFFLPSMDFFFTKVIYSDNGKMIRARNEYE